MKKFERLGSPLDEIVLFSVHKCYGVIGRHDVIRELGNRCHAGLLYVKTVSQKTFTFKCQERITYNYTGVSISCCPERQK